MKTELKIAAETLIEQMEEVLFNRTLFTGLIVPWLDLWSLWWLYQSCSVWRTLLTDNANVAVFREARLYHHGKLSKVLLAALKRNQQLQRPILQCALAHLQQQLSDEQEPNKFRVSRWLNSTCNPYNWATVPDVTDAMRFLKRGDADTYAKWAVKTGFNAMAARAWEREEMCLAALQGGLPELGFSICGDLSKCDVLDTCFSSKKSTASLEYVLKHDGDAVQERLKFLISGCLVGRTTTLPTLQWVLSYARRHGIAVDYELLYCRLMQRISTGRGKNLEIRKMLEWLCPLAMRQFTQRINAFSSPPRVQPLFPTHGSHRDDCIQLRLWDWPTLYDQWHYAFGHDANCVDLPDLVDAFSDP